MWRKSINSFIKYIIIGCLTLFYYFNGYNIHGHNVNGLFAQSPLYRDEITIYVVPAITDEKILPTSFISYDYISDSISIMASPGEYEPASFVIRADHDIFSLSLETSDLIGTNGIIPSENIDISVVKCWYQAGEHLWVLNNKQKILTPELLLKNDALIKVENEENYIQLISGVYIWVSKIDSFTGGGLVIPIDSLPVRDSDILLPVNISNCTNKQFWVTVKISDNTLPGIYAGTIKIKSGTQILSEVQLEVEVLPITLSEPCLACNLYYRGRLRNIGSISSEYKNEQQLRVELEDMFKHGVNTTSVLQSNALLGEVLDIRNDIGINNQTLFYHWLDINSYGNDLIALKNAVIDLKNFVTPYGVNELYIYGVDESNLNTPEHRAQINAVHEAGGKVDCSQSPNQADSIADILDLAIVASQPDSLLAAKYHNYGHKIVSYANPQVGREKPETYRRNYGLLLWQYNYDGGMDFAYQMGFQNIWNDFDHKYWRDHNFTYPTMDGVIGTIQWEGWRVGVGDIKYLTTLIDVIQQAGAQGQNVSDAEEWIRNLKSSDLSLLDLNVIRETMIGYIVAFTPGSPSDTIPPIITSISHSYINSLGAINITWKTDERSNSQVEYGRSIDLGDSTVLHIPFFYEHSVPISNLEFDTVYYFRVKSTDTSGNLAVSPIDSFSTGTSSDISILFIQPTDTDSAVINRSWTEIKTSINSIYETSSFIDWDRSLIGYWDFNEDSGSITYDKSTYDNNGILTNTCWTTGSMGSSLEFNGANSYVNCGNDISLSIDSSITIEGWFYPKAYVTGYAALPIRKRSSVADANYCMYFYGTTSSCYKCIVFWGNAGGVWQQLSPDCQIDSLNTWYQFAWTYSSEEGGKIYINGELYRDYLVGQGAGLLAMNTEDLILNEGDFNGMLDEIRIWKRILSPNEIKASYNASVYSRSILFPDLTDGCYQYYAYATDIFGNTAQTETRTITVTSTAVNEEVNSVLPQFYALSSNYPNPFSLKTRINYALPGHSEVDVIIYNILGQRVNVLVNELQDPGYYSICWEGNDSHGRCCANGTYFIRFFAKSIESIENYSDIKKVIILR